jgi:hypothetical protein
MIIFAPNIFNFDSIIMKQFYTSGLEPLRTVSGQWTAMGRRLLMMLLFFAFVGGVKASVNLPYTCGRVPEGFRTATYGGSPDVGARQGAAFRPRADALPTGQPLKLIIYRKRPDKKQNKTE